MTGGLPRAYGPWLAFEEQLAQRIKGLERAGLSFSGGRQCIPGFPFDGFRADAALTDGRNLLAVEVEVRQTHPDTNVGKYWLLREYRLYQKVMLFHVYTPAYDSYGWRKTLGAFYAQKMSQDSEFEYVLVDKREAQDLDRTLDEVFDQVRMAVDVLFASPP